MSEITGVKVQDFKLDGSMPIVLLERVSPLGIQPEYCVHGKVSCCSCQDWCWLGSETHKLVSNGEAVPVCMECATNLIPPGSVPADHVEDHRRADGPHS